MPSWPAWQGLFGVALIPIMAWALSESRSRAVTPPVMRFALGALLLQAAIALVLLKLPGSRVFFDTVGAGVLSLQRATDEGARMVFGYLAGGPPPFAETQASNGYLLAFRMLPMILVIAALMRVLFHWGILQRVVAAFAFVLRRAIGVDGPLATVASASIFLGPVEAPLMIRPYVKDMGRGALFATMTVAMATVAGTVLALYASILAPHVPGAAGHLLAASVMNVPAALMLARLAVPEGFSRDRADETLQIIDDSRSTMDAVTRGTIEGLSIAATVAAMLIVAVAFVALANAILAAIGGPLGMAVTLQSLLGLVGAPLAWIIGIPSSETGTAGALLGEKMVLNEFLAYLDLARTDPTLLSERSRLILTYALCSFANLGSLGIMIGGLTQMVPERRDEVVALAPKSVLIGFLATLLSAAMVGLIVGP